MKKDKICKLEEVAMQGLIIPAVSGHKLYRKLTLYEINANFNSR